MTHESILFDGIAAWLMSLNDSALTLFGKRGADDAVNACKAGSLRALDMAVGDALTDAWLVHNRPEDMPDEVFLDYAHQAENLRLEMRFLSDKMLLAAQFAAGKILDGCRNSGSELKQELTESAVCISTALGSGDVDLALRHMSRLCEVRLTENGMNLVFKPVASGLPDGFYANMRILAGKLYLMPDHVPPVRPYDRSAVHGTYPDGGGYELFFADFSEK